MPDISHVQDWWRLHKTPFIANDTYSGIVHTTENTFDANESQNQRQKRNKTGADMHKVIKADMHSEKRADMHNETGGAWSVNNQPESVIGPSHSIYGPPLAGVTNHVSCMIAVDASSS